MHHSIKTEISHATVIDFDLEGDVVRNIVFTGGCNGNLKGIAILCEGMTVSQIESKLRGNTCNNLPSSCPDQLAIAVRKAYDIEQAAKPSGC